MGEASNKERVTVTFSAEAHERLRAVASASSVSIGWVVRYAVDEFLRRHIPGSAGQLVLPLHRSKGDGAER
mgnify:CR=1 FL=1